MTTTDPISTSQAPLTPRQILDNKAISEVHIGYALRRLYKSLVEIHEQMIAMMKPEPSMSVLEWQRVLNRISDRLLEIGLREEYTLPIVEREQKHLPKERESYT